MSIVQRIAKNISALFAGQITVTILTTILAIAVARNLGDIAFGKFSFALAFAFAEGRRLPFGLAQFGLQFGYAGLKLGDRFFQLGNDGAKLRALLAAAGFCLLCRQG